MEENPRAVGGLVCARQVLGVGLVHDVISISHLGDVRVGKDVRDGYVVPLPIDCDGEGDAHPCMMPQRGL